MAWVYLIIAGLFEITWAIGLKYAEGFTKITWEIEAANSEFSRLTLTHEMASAPVMAGMVSSKFSEQGTGGWSWILSDMKSLIETGSTL